ncbi:MAG: hypothetical protein L3J28_12370 [Candidatus Polarisedimenticolaceae bacterium]|nr:hypothetical protein [Candidatus Polarisedimenticolaceae bacterium]
MSKIADHNDYFLAIDQGGHASRAIVFDPHGNIITSASHEITTHHPAADRVEHDPQQLIDSIQHCLLTIAKQLGPACRQIHSAGLATQRSSIICWNRYSGEALSPVLSWQDSRAHAWLDSFAIQRQQIHAITGLRLSAHYGVSKLRWCLEQLPAVAQAAKEDSLVFGPLASYLLFKLLDEQPLLVDPANASRTLLWDHRQLNWSPELLTLFDIPATLLPRCVASWHHYGTLQVGEHSLPLQLCTGDQSAALFANGRAQSDTLYINIGTGAFLQRPSDGSTLECDHLLCSVIHQQQGETHYVTEGTVNGAGAALAWAQQQLGLQQGELPLADWLQQHSEPPLFLNAVSGLGSPYWRTGLSSRFVGEAGVEAKMVAVVESILFLLQRNIQLLSTTEPLRQILISGGLATIDPLCQRLADLSGLTIKRPENHEATAQGVAFLLAGQPHWPTQQSTFTPHTNQPLQSRFQQWQKLMAQALKMAH